MTTPALRVAQEEWRLMRRDRVAAIGLLLVLLLATVAAITSWSTWQQAHTERQRHQARVNAEFQAQPDRHPHRMVHYGHFVFRPLNPLAAFDSGIDAYTGHTLFLEGHRQNSANFGDVRQSSLLLRFGQLTPAFVLQVLAPLLLVFLGHAAVARERETGTLRLLLAQGVRPMHLVLGKLLALLGPLLLLLLPASIALTAMVAIGGAAPGPALALLGGHALGLLAWALVVVAASAAFPRARDALLALLAAWVFAVVLVPRLAAERAAHTHALTPRAESEVTVARELAAIGNSHNPDDPHFSAFRARVLAEYGVSRVEDLPVNYKGLVGMEGERLTSELFDRHARAAFEQQAHQSDAMDGFAWLSPTLALRRLSMAAAGTDLDSHRRFLEQGEAHRYELVQALNQIQVDHIGYADDRNPDKQNRVDHTHWHDLPDFVHEPRPWAETRRVIAQATGLLLLWLGAAVAALVLATRRLERTVR